MYLKDEYEMQAIDWQLMYSNVNRIRDRILCRYGKYLIHGLTCTTKPADATNCNTTAMSAINNSCLVHHQCQTMLTGPTTTNPEKNCEKFEALSILCFHLRAKI